MADPAGERSDAEQKEIRGVQAGRGDRLSEAAEPAVARDEVPRRMLAPAAPSPPSHQLAWARALRRQAGALREDSMVARAHRQADRDGAGAVVGERVEGARDRFWAAVRPSTGRAATSDGQEPVDRQFEVRHDVVQTLYGVGLSLQATLPLTQQQDLRGHLERAVRDLDAVIAALRSQLGQRGPTTPMHDLRAPGSGHDPG